MSGLGLYLDNSEIDRVLGEAGYAGASAALRTELEGYLRERSTAEYVSVFGGGVDAALSVLRTEKALRDYYATEADRETLSDFEATQGPAIDEIEAKFFEKLETRHNDLRQQARENRGEFFRSLIELGAGTQDAYYNSLSASEQAEMNTLRDALYTAGDGFTAAQKSALAANRSEYQHEFAHRSAQEFISSGLPDQIEQRMVAYYQRTGTPAELALVEQHRSALGRAYAETLQIKAGTRAGYSAAATAALAAVAGSQAKLEAAAQTADKDFAEIAGKQTVLLDRYYTNHAETDAERQALSGNQRDAGRTNPWAALDWRSDASGAYARADRETQELAAAMILSAKEQEVDINRTLREYQQKQAIAEAMIRFATQRGDDLRKSVYTNYRTYLGQENVYIDQEYADYLVGNPPTPKSKAQLNGGQLLDANTLAVDPNSLFGNANWEDSLTSDLATNGTLVELGRDTGTPTDDRDIYIKRLNTATNAGTLSGLTGMAGVEYAYNSHLANEYIEAISQLNAAFAGVIRAAGMADERRTDTAEQRLATALAGYNADAAANVNNLNGLLQMQQLAAADAAANSDNELQSQQGDIQDQYRVQNDVARKYADAARRKQLVGSSLRDYVIAQFQPIANEYETAQADVNALALAGETLQQQYATATGDQIAAYNDLAQRHQRFQYSNDEYEKRLAIQEYAETPYLYTTGDDEGGNLEEWSASAEQEYERAYQILQTANERLKQAGYAILEQDQLPEFNALVTLYQAGTPPSALTAADVTRMTELLTKKYSDDGGLNAAEETELAGLKQRQQYMRYSELIAARADHIKHTMRMVRLQKAQQILNGEIEKRRAVVNEKEAAFRSALDNKFPPPSRGVPGKTQEELENARLAVYARFAQANEAGKTNFADEFQGWYWSGGAWMSQLGVSGASAIAAGSAVAITPSMITAALAGSAYASGIPPADQAAIGLYMASGGLPEYSGFQSIYTGMLMSAMTQDLMALQYSITSAIMWPVYSIGTALTLGVTSLINTYLSSVLLAPLAIPLFPMQLAGAAMASSALAQILSAQLTWQISLLMMVTMMFATVSAGQMTGIEEVRSKQRQYDDAQASLNYFTKVGSIEELKDRAQAWGAQHNDEDAGETGSVLFELTDEDLKYLIENGNMTGLSAEEQTEALDLTAQKDTTKFYDSYGRRYDPNSITTTYPGPVIDGKYGGTHTRITRQLPNGTTEYAYALVIPDSQPANEVYSMDSIFDAAVSHGMGLRNLRRDRYESAGANAAAVTQDGTFVLNERDATYDYLYGEATRAGVGGREFAGYTMAYEDYERNVRNVFEGELQQREAVQRKEWEYRAAELQSRYEAWERRMATVLERGAKAWQRSEDRYLQAQRDWERDEDRKAEESQEAWDAAIQAHYTKREQWETDVRNAAATGTISNNLTQAVSGINDQIAQFEAATGLSMPQVDRQAFVNQAIQELQLKQPSLTERFQNVNQSISSFNTTMSLSQMAGTDLTGLSALGATFRAQVREHERDMRVYTNTKMFEQYQKLEDNFIEQIKRQDKAIEQETRMAALGAGLFESGDVFIKASAVQQGGFGGFVNAYKNFDVEGEVARLKAEQGQSGQSMLEGEALVSFLQGANDVEVDAYFQVAKLQMESVFYKIVGRGNSEERLRSKELADIGTFGVWAGRKPGSEELSGLSQAAAHYAPGQFAQAAKNGGALDMLNYANGFGELGALGPRPGGAPMGFYAQLDLLGRLNGKWESSALSDAAYVDPASAFMNQINPAMMMANSIKNVEVGSQVYGRDRGNLIEAQLLSVGKTAVKAVGAVIATVGNILAPGVALAVGTAIMALADTIQVDTQTGKRSMKMTEQQAYGIAANVVPGGMLFTLGAQYDEKGRYTGNWQINDDSLTMGIKQGISSALATVPGGAVIAEGINVAMDTSIQHYKYQQGHQNDYIAMTTVGVEGMDRFGEAVGTTIGKDVIGPSASPGADSNLPNGSEKGLWDIFGGAADWMRRKSEMLDGYLNPIKLLAKGLDAVGADSAGNLLRGRGYNSNEELEARQVAQYQAYLAQKERAAYERAAAGEGFDEYTSGLYGRELAAQLGMKKDGRGVLYNEVLAEAKRLRGEEGTPSLLEMEVAARNVAARHGLNPNGALNYGAALEGVSNARDADTRARQNRGTTQYDEPIGPQQKHSGDWLLIQNGIIGSGLGWLDGKTGWGLQERAQRLYNQYSVESFDRQATGYYHRSAQEIGAAAQSAQNTAHDWGTTGLGLLYEGLQSDYNPLAIGYRSQQMVNGFISETFNAAANYADPFFLANPLTGPAALGYRALNDYVNPQDMRAGPLGVDADDSAWEHGLKRYARGMVGLAAGGSDPNILRMIGGASGILAMSNEFAGDVMSLRMPGSVNQALNDFTTLQDPNASPLAKREATIRLSYQAADGLVMGSAIAGGALLGRILPGVAGRKADNTFRPQGLVDDPLATPAGRAIYLDLRAMDPTANVAVILDRARTLLKSGSNLPIEKFATSSTELYKLVPKGEAVTPYSPFFMTKKELSLLQRFPEEIKDRVALPMESHAHAYDIYKVKPRPGKLAVYYDSIVAPTKQGLLHQHGGGVQSLIPNRGAWTDPEYFGTIYTPR